MDSNGQNQGYLWCTGFCRQPVMSPVAAVLAVIQSDLYNDQITIYDIVHDDHYDLTNGSWDNQDPAWSPNGSKIVISSEESGNRDLYVVDLDGTDKIQITNDPADDFSPDWAR